MDLGSPIKNEESDNLIKIFTFFTNFKIFGADYSIEFKSCWPKIFRNYSQFVVQWKKIMVASADNTVEDSKI